MSVLRRHKIAVLRAPLVDDGRGNESRDWDAATEHESKGWAIQTGSPELDLVNREGGAIAYTITGPLDADLLASDRVRLMGEVFTLDGSVGRQPGASAATAHSVARLRTWEG